MELRPRKSVYVGGRAYNAMVAEQLKYVAKTGNTLPLSEVDG
jgi:hypothetical protein